MKKIISILLVLCMVFSLAACGAAEDDPNAGVYTATKASMSGIEISVTDFLEEGFTIELKNGGKCKLSIDGQTASGKWTLDGTAFTVSGGGVDESGTLENGVITLDDVMDSGVTFVFEKQ